MSDAIRDREEVEIVLQTLVRRTCLEDMLEPLHPTEEAIELTLHTGTDEETEVALANDDGKVVCVLYVDLVDDPLNDWTIKLRGWKLANDVASV